MLSLSAVREGTCSYYLKRLHSLTGLIPVGVFIVVHFVLNTFALGGPERYDFLVHGMHKVPIIPAVEVFVLLIPIAYHAIYGVVVTFKASSNVGTYGYYSNWMYLWQRVTGIIVFVFIVQHVLATRVANIVFGTHIDYAFVAAALSNPVVFAWYVVGVLAAVFHFTNGLWGMAISWGITGTAESQRVWRWICNAMCVVLAIWGIGLLMVFR